MKESETTYMVVDSVVNKIIDNLGYIPDNYSSSVDKIRYNTKELNDLTTELIMETLLDNRIDKSKIVLMRIIPTINFYNTHDEKFKLIIKFGYPVENRISEKIDISEEFVKSLDFQLGFDKTIIFECDMIHKYKSMLRNDKITNILSK